jgi:hypothetical protein
LAIYMKKFYLGLFVLILFSSPIRSQSTFSQRSFSKSQLVKADLDTAKLLSDTPLKSSMGAVLRSAVLPGWGQVYNEKYLKGLFLLGVNGSFGYAIYHYHKEWEDTGEKQFQEKRNLYTWYFGLSYFLTLIDAYIDAYLYGFDKAIELATLEANNKRSILGISVKVKI